MPEEQKGAGAFPGREGTLLTPSGKQNCTGQEAEEPGQHIRLE